MKKLALTALFSTMAGSAALGQVYELEVEAYIDGRSHLVVNRNTVRWEHLDFCAPGRFEGRNEPTYLTVRVDGETFLDRFAWVPEWPIDPPDWICFPTSSSVFEGLGPPLPEGYADGTIEAIQARHEVSIVQLPTAANDFTLIIEFNDNPPNAADWYHVRVTLDPVLPPHAVAVRADAGDGGDGRWWATAFTELQEAIDYAAGSSGAVNEVWIAAGEILPMALLDPADPQSATFALSSDVGIFGGFAGNEFLREDRDPDAHPTVVTHDPDNSRYVFVGDGTDASAVLDGLTIRRPDSPPEGVREFLFENGGTATIRNCVVETDASGYLDIHPDPNNPSPPVLQDTRFKVTVKPDQFCGRQGSLLELRSEDHDCGGEINPDCESGVFSAADSVVFQEDPSLNWVIDTLEIEPGVVLNLTNRDGFDFDPGETPEALYVKNLIKHEGATLNTGLNTLYYENLVQGDDFEDVPLRGFSLVNIDMECGEEFDIRVRKRTLQDPFDDPNDPNTPKGAIERIVDTDGFMQMRTKDPNHVSSISVAASGSFAKAAEEAIVVAFEYRFVQNPDAALIVYLSDAPDTGSNRRPIATITPPVDPDRAGAIGNPDFAVFYGEFPRGDLNFRRGTYVELELIGLDAIVDIDNWDPQIECTSECGNLDAAPGVDGVDYLLSLASYGRELDFDDQDFIYCVDSQAANDEYVDLADVLAWDVHTQDQLQNVCGSGLALPGRGGTPVDLPAGEALLLAGKPRGVDSSDQDDRIFALDPAGACLGVSQPPASDDIGNEYRGNGRFVEDGDGIVYQLHALQGLIRLDTAETVLAPREKPFGDDLVYVGVNPQSGDDFLGLPITDAAFDPADPSIVYVVPVVVEPDASNRDRYRAAARLQLLGGGDYEILNLYGVDPRFDPECTNTVPPGPSECYVQSLREIEVDELGNVYVLSAYALNANDWVLVYDAELGNAAAHRIDVSDMINGPVAMKISRHDPDRLILASGLDELPDDTLTRLYRFSIEREGDAATGLSLASTLDIQNPVTDPNQAPDGYVAQITGIDEDAADGTLYVAGFTAPYFPDDVTAGELVDRTGGVIFTLPTLAIVPTDASGTLAATTIDCDDLALPLAIKHLGGADGCPGDVNGDDEVGLDDLSTLLTNFGLTDGQSREDGDLDGDGDVDLTDLSTLLQHFGDVCT